MAGNKRLLKELAECQQNPPPGCKIALENDEDILIWNVTMAAPSDSVYAGGNFKILIKLPKEYPFKPPQLNFKTKVYHPNVTNDENGSMCLGMLRADEWKPPNKIADVLKLVRTVLASPQPDDAVEQGIAEQYKNNRKEFDKIAKDWVNKYAK
ncbi:hypothetical protein LTR62_004186 [Meristemomyces frigidus]|uniref:E2 ubiquitin-conjugating enzyme n=1 Tax=Meristemomyces frigidus TaxID=1508187 RepID=A0AAN7TQD2_9PEZI|nr:hypothetical protein LTR62_004186 [Meristemomyces frigidus]